MILPEPIPVKRQRGFVTVADVRGGEFDYLTHAYALALSLRRTQKTIPWLSVLVPPGCHIGDRYREVFDEVIELRGEDLSGEDPWKVHNKWNVYFHTPYLETVLLDADMLFVDDVIDWWDVMAAQDVWACTDVLTYRNEPFTSTYYRKTFVANELPNIYTAFTFFRRSKLAAELFLQAREVVKDWEKFIPLYVMREPPRRISADVAFALAMKVRDIQAECTRPGLGCPTFVHMRSHGQNWGVPVTEDWTRHVLSYMDRQGRITVGNHKQIYPLHYQDKAFLTDEIISLLERIDA